MSIHGIPLAHHYFFIPAKELASTMAPDNPEEDTVFVGDWRLLNELAVHMDDTQVLGTFGIGDERCMIIVDMGKKECEERIELAKQSLEKGYELHVQEK